MLQNLIPLQADAAAGGWSSMIMIVLLIAIFYFLMIRPQQKEIKKFRDALAKGDNVITAGGIYGRICEVKENAFIISIADGVKIKIDKGSVYPSASDAQEQQAAKGKE